MELILKEECFAVVGACMEVYNQLGAGFLEPVYQEALQFELGDRKIPFQAQTPLPIRFKTRMLSQTYRPDLVCYGKIIVEIKAVRELADEHRAQVLNYLHASGLRLGLLVNFCHPLRLEWERLVV